MLPSPATSAETERLVAQLRAALGDAAFQEAWSSGQSLAPEQAVVLALGSQ